MTSEVNRLVADFLRKYGDMGLERLDGEEAPYDRLREALESLPFLASKKMVIIRNGSANKEFVEHAERLLSDLPDSTDAVLIESKLDKRSSYYKFLKKSTDYHEYNELDGPGLARWLVGEAKAAKATLSQADAMYLVDRVGTNQLLLSNELKKLTLYSSVISRETIELLTERTPQSTIFELLDAAFSGQTKKALAIYEEQRALKVEPMQLMAMIAWQLHVLAVIKTAENKTPDEIARSAKLNPFVVKKSQRIANRLTLNELKALVARVLDLDITLKSKSIDADEAIKNLLLELAN